MKNFFMFIAATSLFAWPASSSLAAPRDRNTIEDAITVLEELAEAPEKSVPPALLREADAVIIAPNVIKGGLIVAGRHGHGLLLIRRKDGSWGDPIFVMISGGSVGLQIGVQATDIFLVVRNRRSLERIMSGNNKVTLGADASVAAGPLGRQASAATDASLRAEILSYSRNRGVFAGVALEGDALRIDWEANDRYYGQRAVTVADIVGGKLAAPASTETLRTLLSKWQEKPAPKTFLEPPVLPVR